jgi:hypothetical protein
MSATRRRRLGNVFMFEPRGPIERKGKGRFDTYRVREPAAVRVSSRVCRSRV